MHGFSSCTVNNALGNIVYGNHNTLHSFKNMVLRKFEIENKLFYLNNVLFEGVKFPSDDSALSFSPVVV